MQLLHRATDCTHLPLQHDSSMHTKQLTDATVCRTNFTPMNATNFTLNLHGKLYPLNEPQIMGIVNVTTLSMPKAALFRNRRFVIASKN